MAVIARALALAAVVPRDAAIGRAQRGDLRREQRRVPQQPVAEHDRLARAPRAGVLDVQLRAVDLHHSPTAEYRSSPSSSRCSSATTWVAIFESETSPAWVR